MNVCFVFPSNHSSVQLIWSWCTYDAKHKMSSLFVLYEYIFFSDNWQCFFVVHGLCVWGDVISSVFSLWIWPCLHMFSISRVRRRQVDNANKLHATLPWQGRTLFANSLEVGDTYSRLMDSPSGSPNAVFTVRGEEWVPHEWVGKEPVQRKTGSVQVNIALLKGHCQYSLR